MLYSQNAEVIARRVQGSLHYATLTNLAPNTKYFYRYGDSALALFSQEYSLLACVYQSCACVGHFWSRAWQLLHADHHVSRADNPCP